MARWVFDGLASTELIRMPQGDMPGDNGSATMSTQQLGLLIRQFRAESGLSVSALSASSGVSSGLISQVERGLGNPGFTTLLKLAQALGVAVGDFFGAGGPTDEPARIVRGSARRRLQVAEPDMIYELLTPTMSGKLGMLRAQISAGWSNENLPFRHEGEECVLIAVGSLVVYVDSVRHELCVGDSITYDASLPHWYANETTDPAVLIGAMTPPSF
ncbi:helix-turn-helix domain-containing protein [Rhodococcus ruber]|uniref:Helix-turn-helix domain-containing protein n=1 Tax=Rhodococcus ruber TaxID=1830 RepID=A0ABT4MMS7_9NOCA|nr:cupin domain-containing protein [Rhodococcus ruber]MCZ4522296.1 helix-turn-helix domain-containing protein [Rhodococcus ruber]